MPPVRQQPAQRRRSREDMHVHDGEQVRASSVVFGLVIIAALIVASAAWMGGSMSVVERRAGGVMDAGARMLGLSVAQVRVVGLEHAPDIEAGVRAAIMVEPGENMFRADPEAIRQRVEGAGRVANVRVHRFWPDTVLVMADPARPVALWYGSDGWRTVDAGGKPGADVLTSATPELAALLRIEGEGAAEAMPELVAALEGAPVVAARLTSAVRLSERRWSLRLTGGVVVHLPDDTGRRAGDAEKGETTLTLTLAAIEDMQARTDFLNGSFRLVDARFVVPRGTTGNVRPEFLLTPRASQTAAAARGRGEG